jgi:hypothetical protein
VECPLAICDSSSFQDLSIQKLLALLLFGFLPFMCSFLPRSDAVPPLKIGGATIDVDIDPAEFHAPSTQLNWWVSAAANAVNAYYGKFPLPRTELHINSFDGHGVRNGKTFGRDNEGLIRISLGSDTTLDQLREDWMLTHEMVHLTFPSVSEDHHWIEEGIASYVEPFARMQAGNLQATRVWGDMMRDMWQGLPREGDEGLDRTHTWASTYWGGALFCLMADVKIRQQTKNKKGLQDALRGIMNAGGNVAQDWDLRHALQVGDQATGTHVLEELYERMRDKPVPVDLDSLWKQLGVERQDGVTRFREDAPWASIRRSINAGKAQP